jgi:hypothetical protein
MKFTSHTARGTTTHRVTSGELARRAVTLSVAGALACLAIPPTTAHADQVTADGVGASTYSRDIDDVVAEQKTHRARDYVEGVGASTYSRDIDDVVAAQKTHRARDYVELAAARAQFVSQQQRTALAHIVVAVSRSGPAADATCYIPESLDQWTRRLIAVQFCSKAHVVPADLPTLVPYGEPVPQAVGHCGHQGLHQPPTASDLPVSAWYTPTSC